MSRQDRWLLIRLAAQNVGRRRLRAMFLGAAVMLGVGVGFASFVAGWALWQGMAQSFSRMGADLLVVPRATLVNITSSLVTVQPTDETLPAELVHRIARVPGIARVAPQRVVPALVEGQKVNLIAFDPARDFSVLSWIEARQDGAAEGLIAGGALSAALGETLSVCGMPMRLVGRLGRTGVGPFDESYFLTFDALADVVSFCRRSETSAKSAAPAKVEDTSADMRHADVCSGDLALDRISAFLLQLSPAAKREEVKFALAGLGDIKIVEGNGVLTSSRQALSTLLAGVAVFTLFELAALLILLALLFSAIVQERYREVGLLRAMGAKPHQVTAIILAEAAVITGLGGLAGLGFGAGVLLTFARSLGFYFALLGVPFSWPPAAVIEAGAVLAIVCSVALGLLGAFVPAWRVRRMAPLRAHSSGRAMTLSAQSLTKRYGAAPGHAAVRGASLEVGRGEFISIVGRSGSGKSTLMAMLGALTPPTAGRLLLDGTDVWTLPETERATFRACHVGFVFQFPSLLSNLTAADNVAVPALLARSMPAEEAYARAHELLARVGLADRAEAYPDGMSGGEQRRVAVARALINAPPLLLADEPTSDLDEDTEADIIDLLDDLQQRDAFGLVLVTHDLGLAARAQRSFEMRQGMLAPRELPRLEAAPRRSVTPASVAAPPVVPPRAPVRLGGSFWRGVRIFLPAAAAILAAILLADFGVETYQSMRLRERAARYAALQHVALNRLRGDVQSVTDLGDGRYELTAYLQNVGGEPIYVMTPQMRAFVQVASLWQEVPMTPAEENATGVTKIIGKQTYRYRFDARVRDFAQLLPNYMHVRFSGSMLVSPSSTPNGDVFERKDNYYVYLKPFDVADEVVLRRMRFSGKPPVWIPMPPH